MELKSVFNEGEKIPDKYTAYGEDINPPLEIIDVPGNAKSLVLILEDPDAPGKIWTHWILWNIPPKTNKIKENNFPEKAKQGLNDFGKTSYGGPNPPSGTHKYLFKLYALDIFLNLDEGSKKNEVIESLQGHVLSKAVLKGTFSKK